jgi:hypothetical protein
MIDKPAKHGRFKLCLSLLVDAFHPVFSVVFEAVPPVLAGYSLPLPRLASQYGGSGERC